MRRIILGLTLAAVFAAGCQGVVNYRGVQRDFQDAVMRDNEATVSAAFIDPSTGYQDVFDTLSPEYIKGEKKESLKEARLRPNAWMLRAVAAWRLKKYNEATKAAEAGLALEPAPGSRDAIIMQIIPGLTRESAIMDLWVQSGRSFTQDQYDRERDNLAKAFNLLSNVRATEATPKSTLDYVYYQQWRLLQNWRQVIKDVKDASDDDKRAMHEWVKTNVLNGMSLREAADATRDKIVPKELPLRKLIAAEGGG